MVIFGQSGCIREKWLYSGNSGSIGAKVVLFGKRCCFWAKLLYWGKSGSNRAKVVVFGQKMLYSDLNGCDLVK